jgi:hypothetical protein
MNTLPIEQYYISRNWAIGSDGIQWVLQSWNKWRKRWEHHWFVRSDREILERGMQFKRVPIEDQQHLLSGLPSTFDEWRATQVPISA